MSKITLYGRRGWGSAIVEAQLEWLGLDYTYEAVGDLLRSAEARRSLAPVNPLAQVPTLVLPNGQILTESAAITLYLADMTGRDDLVAGFAGAARFPTLADLPRRQCLPDLHLRRRTGPLCAGRGGEGRLSGSGRRLRAAALRHPRGDGAHTLVSRRTLLRTRHLYSGHDPLAAGTQMVRRERAATLFDRDAGGRDPAAASRLVAQFLRRPVVKPLWSRFGRRGRESVR